jgi:hypothetical protein
MIESLDKLKLDKEGFIINEASLLNIKEPFLSQANWVLLNYVHCEYNNAMDSAYLIGDIPRGLGEENKSKINLLVVLHKGNKHICQYVKYYYLNHPNPYDFKVHIEVISYDDIFANNYGSLKYKFLLKTSAVCIFGRDLSATIRKYTKEDLNRIFDV